MNIGNTLEHLRNPGNYRAVAVGSVEKIVIDFEIGVALVFPVSVSKLTAGKQSTH